MPPLRFGVIGFRTNGSKHAETIAASKGARLVAVAELLEERRENARKIHDLDKVYESYDALVADDEIDAVTVSLPVPLHYPAARAALEAGKHVLCEKPPTSTSAQTKKLVDLAKRKGLTLSWGLQRRYTPPVRLARREIDKGVLGNIYRIHARYSRMRWPNALNDQFRMLKDGGGVFYDLGVHVLDMCWSLLGCPRPLRVVAANHTAFPDWNGCPPGSALAEDNSMSLIFFEGGAVVSIDTCFYANRADSEPGQGFRVQIMGDRAGFDIPSRTLVDGGPRKARTRVLSVPKSYQKEERLQMYADFIKAATGKGELLIRAEDGVDLMRMIEAVIKSGDQGREIRLNGRKK